MDAIQLNKTITETSERSRWGGNGLYNNLFSYQRLVGSLKHYANESATSLANFFKDKFSFPSEISEITLESTKNLIFNELNKNNIQKSVKIIAVRHPLARLQSCWRDKMSYWYTDNGKTIKHDQILFQMWSPMWKYINENLETSRSNQTKGYGNIVSFEGFLKFITLTHKHRLDQKRKKRSVRKNNYEISRILQQLQENSFVSESTSKIHSRKRRSTRTDHWLPIFGQCAACMINYNIIAKIETAAQDAEHIKQLLKVEAIGDFSNAYQNTEMDYANYERNLGNLYQNISKTVMDDVCEMYKWDFLLFDYDIKKFCGRKFW